MVSTRQRQKKTTNSSTHQAGELQPKNLIDSVLELQNHVFYRGILQDICLNRFHKIYWIQDQLQLWKDLCRLKRTQVVFVSIPELTERAHANTNIFYLCILAKFKNLHLELSSAITEKNDEQFVDEFISTWVKHGAPAPSGIIVPLNFQYLEGVILGFNTCDMKTYNRRCLEYLQGTSTFKHPCIVRLDFGQVVNSIANLDCFKEIEHTAIKEFYLDVIIIIATTENFDDFLF